MTLRRLVGSIALTLLPVAAAHANPVSLINPGFEADWVSASANSDGNVTFNYHPTGPNLGWVFGTTAGFGSGVGVASNYYFTAFEGQRFAFLQLATEPLSQAFTLNAAGMVTLSFEMSLRPGYNTGQTVRVLLDGQKVADLATGTTAGWVHQSLAFGNLSAGSHTLAFQGLANFNSTGDTTAYLDDVKLNLAPSVTAVPEPSTYALMGMGMVAIGGFARRRQGRHA